MPMLPWLFCPLAGQARLGQNVGGGAMRIFLSLGCWGACQEGVCLDPHFCYKCFSPRLSVELPLDSVTQSKPRNIHTITAAVRGLGLRRWLLVVARPTHDPCKEREAFMRTRAAQWS